MIPKIVTPKTHGIIDYGFGAALLLIPSLLKLNKKAIQTYLELGTAFLAMNVITDTPVAVKRLISFEDHQKADAGYLTSLSLLTVAKHIRKDPRALRFNLAFLAIGCLHYVLTDYNAPTDR